MKYLRRFTVPTILSAAAVAALAQAPPQIQVLEMPGEVRRLPVHRAEGILSVHYEGHLTPERHIWVRVFRDSINDLRNKYPAQTPPGQCVLYTHAVRFQVAHAFDQELRINDLVTFFAAAHLDRQTLTLVFEEGDDPSANGPLKLEKSAVSEYFNNAVQMPLVAPDDMKRQWELAARKLAESKKPGKPGILEPPPVYAGETAPPPPPPATAFPDRYFQPPCQTVKPIHYVTLRRNQALEETATLEALKPVAMRTSQTCGE